MTGNKHFCCKPDPVSSGCEIGGVVRTDIADADCLEASTTGCIRHLLTEKQYKACLAAQPQAVAATKKLCEAYAKRMDARVKEAAKLNCAFLSGSGGWNQPFKHWNDQCVNTPDAETQLIPYQERPLEQQLASCRKGADGGGNTAKVVAETTVYSDASGNGAEVCHLFVGDTVSVLGPDGNFTKISGNSGECKGKQGVVFTGDNALQNQ